MQASWSASGTAAGKARIERGLQPQRVGSRSRDEEQVRPLFASGAMLHRRHRARRYRHLVVATKRQTLVCGIAHTDDGEERVIESDDLVECSDFPE